MLSLLFRFRRFLSLVLCVFVSVWLKNSDLNQRMGVAHGIQVTILSPVQFIVSKANALGNVLRENRGLREENVRLRAENDILNEAKKENREFRRMLEYKEASTVNTGSMRGVRKDMPVITLDGVAGKIIEVYPFHSNVQLINDPSSRTGVLFTRLNVPGILECRNGYTPIINVFSHHPVQPGDSVITSGLGGIFPKGLYIGKVLRVTPGDDMFNSAEIDLHGGLDNVSHAFIMNLATQWKPFNAADTAVRK
jgi:rod shape-determining protein MreC